MKKTYLLGDHHANYDDFIRVLMRRGLRDVRIIHVGDGEEGYPESWDEESPVRLDNAFAALDIEYLSIRGNHSNPNAFDGSIMLPNFKLLPDYTRMEINGESWLFVGGAISINRIDRISEENWWPAEKMVLREELAVPADVLVTHTGPSWFAPPSNPLVEYYIHQEEDMGRKNLRQELLNEQLRHDRLFKLVRPKFWYYGHYHHRAIHQHQGCEIRQLDVAELAHHVS